MKNSLHIIAAAIFVLGAYSLAGYNDQVALNKSVQSHIAKAKAREARERRAQMRRDSGYYLIARAL